GRAVPQEGCAPGPLGQPLPVSEPGRARGVRSQLARLGRRGGGGRGGRGRGGLGHGGEGPGKRTVPGGGGLTLLELVVVLAVLAIVTALALPSIRRGAQSLQLRTSAGRVASLLREARLQAVTHRRPARVALESSHRGATLAWEGTDEPLRRVELPEQFRLLTVAGGESLTFSPRGL